MWDLTGQVLPVGIYEFRYRVRLDSFLPAGTVIRNGASVVHAWMPVPQTAQAPATVRGDFLVQVRVFNEAGEVVRTILVNRFSEAVREADIREDKLIEALGDEAEIYYKGVLIGTWDGRNDRGDPVSNGTYFVKIDNVDSFGTVETVTQAVVVDWSLARVQVRVYNGAGELVRELGDVWANQMPAAFGAALSSSSFSPHYEGTDPLSTLTITLSNGLVFTWDGRNEEGRIVSGGQYYVEVRTTDGEGGEAVVVRGVGVQAAADSLPADVRAVPNPWIAKIHPPKIVFEAGAPGYTVSISLYTLAGELVGRVHGDSGSGWALWDLSARPLASGLYLAETVLTAPNGDWERRVLKVLIVR